MPCNLKHSIDALTLHRVSGRFFEVNDQPNRVTCSELLFLCNNLPTYIKPAHKEVSLKQIYMTLPKCVAQISSSNIINLLSIC